MDKIDSTPRDPENVDTPVGGAYTTGTNPSPGGTLEVNEVAPLADRSDGTSESAVELQESISRQLPS